MLTQEQMAILKAGALLDPEAAVYVQTAQDANLADWFNVPSAFIVWRSSLSPDDARQGVIGGAAQLDALSAGKRDSLLYLVSGELRVSDPSVRAAVDDLCGSQNALKASLQAAMKRPATRAEKMLATGTGTTATPGMLTWEGYISQGDASQIRF